MKLRRLITRRRAKWAGLTTTGALVAIFGVSVFFSYTYYWTVPTHERLVQVSKGSLYFVSVERHPLFPDIFVNIYPSGFAKASSVSPHWWSFEFANPGDSSWQFALPLWMPALLFALPTGYLFWADHRPKSWQCAKCRYDLRGLEGGVCPECGAQIIRADVQ